jgi:hypothetical protein
LRRRFENIRALQARVAVIGHDLSFILSLMVSYTKVLIEKEKGNPMAIAFGIEEFS